MQQTKIIIAGLIALGALFVGFAWWVWAASQNLHWGVPVLCTLLTLGLALGAVLLPRIQAQRGAEALEKYLRAHTEAGEHEVRSAEIDRMRREFDDAVQALKASRLREKSGDTRDTLSVLPWYAIIGPPACGKTTALRQSGLRFPHVKGTGQRPNLKGLGGTRNLDWFLTNEAILIDTAGRWSVEEAGADRQEWEAFLKLLRKHRPHKPLNGVILAMSLAEITREGETPSVDESPSIVGLGESEVRVVAERMRERLEEIATELGVRLPVYVLFTKCDLLSGFVEMFGNFDAKQRGQIWGFNTRVGEASADPREYFETCFDELCSQLERRALVRLSEESQPEVLERVFGFPAQLRALRDKLGGYLEGLLRDSSFSEAPMLRGVYFTCGTQEGAPAQAMADELAVALGIDDKLAVGEKRDESYFLHDMLLEVVFKDKDLATASDAELLRQKRARRIWMSSAAALSALVLLFAGTSYAVNRKLLAHTTGVLAEVQGAESADQLFSLYEEVVAYERGRPTLLASGLYQGGRIRAPLRELFARELQRRIVRDLYGDNTALLKESLNALEQAPASAATPEPSERYRKALSDALELHLLLGQRAVTASKECPIPTPIAEKDRVMSKLEALWEKRDSATTDEQRSRRAAMLEKYLTLLSPRQNEFHTELAFNTEPSAVSRARRVLGADDAVQRALAALLERYAPKPLLAAELADPSVFVSRESGVPGAFVREAWRQIERDLSDGRLWEATASAGCWVLGGHPVTVDERREALGAELRARYLERYAGAWRAFVSGLSTRAPSSLLDAESLLRVLPEQLETLFQRVKEQATPPPQSGAVSVAKDLAAQMMVSAHAQPGNAPGADQALAAGKQALGGGSTTAVAELAGFTRFGAPDAVGVPVPLDGYRQQLAPVLAALSASKADPTQMAALRVAADAAVNAARLSLAGYGGYRAPLERLLLPPLEATIALATGGSEQLAEDALQQAFCQEVYAPYSMKLAGHFPFKRSYGTGVRAEDVAQGTVASLDTLAALLKPGEGKLWTFVAQQLAGYVISGPAGFRFGQRDGHGGASVLREELLRFLTRARTLSDAVFSGDSQLPRFRFEVTLRGGHGIAKSRFLLGGEEVARYDNGPLTSVRLEWPGKDPYAGVELQLELDDRSRVTPLRLPSVWGLFLLADGTGCADLQGALCELSGRCEARCTSYGANAAQAQRACGEQACYLGLNTGTRAQVQDRAVSLSIPVGRPSMTMHLDLRDVGEQHPLTDPSLFDLRMPSRITQHASSGCAGD